MSDDMETIARARRRWSGADAPTLEELLERARQVGGARSITEVLSADELSFVVEPRRSGEARVDVAAVAAECEAAGASAISIHCDDEPDLVLLGRARAASSMPIIARSFVVDARQACLLREAGADALLTPAAMYREREDGSEEEPGREPETDTLAAIVRTAHRLGAEVVLAVHSEEDLDFALETEVDVLNIDNRRPDGGVDVERTFDLLARVPVGWPVISESIAALEQVPALHRAGVDALLLDEGHLDTGLANALAAYADSALG